MNGASRQNKKMTVLNFVILTLQSSKRKPDGNGGKETNKRRYQYKPATLQQYYEKVI